MKSSLASTWRETNRAAFRSIPSLLRCVFAVMSVTAVAAVQAPNPTVSGSKAAAPSGESSPSPNGADDATARQAQNEYEQAKRALLPLGPAEIRDYRSSRDAAQA